MNGDFPMHVRRCGVCRMACKIIENYEFVIFEIAEISSDTNQDSQDRKEFKT